MEKGTLLLLVLGLVVAGVYLYTSGFFGSSFAITGSTLYMKYDESGAVTGTPMRYWYVDTNVDTAKTYRFSVKLPDKVYENGQEYDLKDGAPVLTLNLIPAMEGQARCDYVATRASIWWPIEGYKLGSPQKVLSFSAQLLEGGVVVGSTTVDPTQAKTYNLKGSDIVLETNNYHQGSIDCPRGEVVATNDVNCVVGLSCMSGVSNFCNKVLGLSAFQTALTNQVAYCNAIGPGLSCFVPQCSDALNYLKNVPVAQDWDRVSGYKKDYTQLSLNKFVAYAPDAGSVATTILLDASKYYEPVVGVLPALDSNVRCAATSMDVTEQKADTFTAYVKNLGASTGTFQVSASTTRGYVSSVIRNVVLQSQEERPVQFGWMPASTNLQQESTFVTVKVVSSNALGDIKTKTADCQMVIHDSSTPPVPHCGNEICEAGLGENKDSCPGDCSSAPKDCSETDGAITGLDGGCYCEAGLDTSYNQKTGELTCSQPFPWWILVLVGIAAVAVLFAIGRNRKGRR
jgi:hypothetical protein